MAALSIIVGCSNGGTKWKEYQNARFGFEIKYPSTWENGEESDNGDGKLLYIGDPDVRIAASAINHVDGVQYDPSLANFTIQELKLDDGEVGDLYVGKEDGMNVMYLYQYRGNVEYTFDVKAPGDFYNENYETLMSVAKSFHILDHSLMD